MIEELQQYIEYNLHDLVAGFADTVQEGKRIKDLWNDCELDNEMMYEFIAYCKEGLSNSIEGEQAKQESL